MGELDEKNPVFLDELIQLAETVVAFHTANVVDLKLRQQLTDAIKQYVAAFPTAPSPPLPVLHLFPPLSNRTVETQLQWAAYTKKKVKTKYAETHKRLIEAEKKLVDSYQAFVKSILLDSPSKVFYEGFTKGLHTIAVVICDFYVTARLAFIEGAEHELPISFDSLKKVWEAISKVAEQPSHQNKDALVDTFQEGTELYAQLAEATSTLAVQPTTEEPVRVVLTGFFNTLNTLNDTLADEINATLQASPDKAKEVLPKTEFAFRELEYLINDLAVIIEDERNKIKKLNLYPIYLRAFELAKDNSELQKEVDDNKENDTLKGSGAKKLDALQKATQKPNAPALVELAKNADIISQSPLIASLFLFFKF